MWLQLERYGIKIVPETQADEAYLEEVLGLKKDGSQVVATRVNAVLLNSWAYLELRRKSDECL